MADKLTDEEGKVLNNTDTELDILKNLEKSFYRANESSKKRNTEKSLKWFQQFVPKNFSRVRTARMFRDKSLWTSRIIPGNMYFFEYDAKTKDILPVWDQYPLIFPWDSWTGGDGNFGESGVQYFIGVNLHYLPPALRFQAMKALLKLRNEKRYRESTRLKISWQVLSGLSQSRFFEHSVKIYRMDQVKSKFVKIPARSWEMAVYLPLARFKKGSKKEAWRIKK